MSEQKMPDAWEPTLHQGYGTTYWTIKRKNPRFMGGVETMLNGNFNPRRFKSEAAARAAIAKATKEQP